MNLANLIKSKFNLIDDWYDKFNRRPFSDDWYVTSASFNVALTLSFAIINIFPDVSSINIIYKTNYNTVVSYAKDIRKIMLSTLSQMKRKICNIYLQLSHRIFVTGCKIRQIFFYFLFCQIYNFLMPCSYYRISRSK